ncbi:MAG: hypothetical protein AAB473_00105 [Patescibacteria group bacterium]
MFGPAPFILVVVEDAVNLVLWFANLQRIFVTIVILFVSICGLGLAWGAEPKDVARAVAVVDAKGGRSEDAIKGLDGKSTPVEIREYDPPQCGGGMSVVRATLGQGVTVTSITVAVKVGRIGIKGPVDPYFVSDVNADGIVDENQLDHRLSIPSAQTIFDGMIHCIVSTTK